MICACSPPTHRRTVTLSVLRVSCPRCAEHASLSPSLVTRTRLAPQPSESTRRVGARAHTHTHRRHGRRRLRHRRRRTKRQSFERSRGTVKEIWIALPGSSSQSTLESLDRSKSKKSTVPAVRLTMAAGSDGRTARREWHERSGPAGAPTGTGSIR